MDKFLNKSDPTSSLPKKDESQASAPASSMDISSISIKKKVLPGMPSAPSSLERPTTMPPRAEHASVDSNKRKEITPPVATAGGFKKGFLSSSGSTSSSGTIKKEASQKERPPHNEDRKETAGGFKRGFFGSPDKKQSSSSASTAQGTKNKRTMEFEYTTEEKADGKKVDRLKNDNKSGEWTINRLPDGKMEASYKNISNTRTSDANTKKSSSSSSSSSAGSGVKSESRTHKSGDTGSEKTTSNTGDDKKPPMSELEKEIERLQNELQEACMERDEYLEKRREVRIEEKRKYMERLKDFNYLKGKVHEPAWADPDRFPASFYDRLPTRPYPDLWVDGGPMSTKNFMGEDRTGKNFFVDPNEELYVKEARRDCHDWNPYAMNMTTMMYKIETLGQDQGIKELAELLQQNELDRDKEGFDEEKRIRDLLIKWIEKTKKEFPIEVPAEGGAKVGEGFLKPSFESDVNFKEMTYGVVNAAIHAAEMDKARFCKEAEEKIPDGDKFIWRRYGKVLFEERRKWEDAKRADPSLPSEGAYNLATRLIWATFDYTKPFDLEAPKAKKSNIVENDGLYRIDPSINKKALPKALRDLL